MDLSRTTLIVAGAHLDAELHDRPTAYRLGDRVRQGLAHRKLAGSRAIVCSDVWYLNNDALRRRPTISVGAPAMNALSAFLAGRLPSVFTIDDQLAVQADLEWIDLAVCCWGSDHGRTAQAVDAFTERYLEDFLNAVADAT
jgi:hypothetical protein